MTQEEKELLAKKDFCARLLHGVKVKILDEDVIPYEPNDIGTIVGKEYINDDIYTVKCERESWCLVIYKHFIPYLRPLSSMTEEEKEELKELIDSEDVDEKGIYFLEGGTLEEYLSQFSYKLCNIINDWLNEHHFDYRSLIEKGLALEAPKDMYND